MKYLLVIKLINQSMYLTVAVLLSPLILTM